MGQPISDIVSISITRETQSVKQANFGVILLVDEFDPGSSPPFTGRTKEYGDLEELAADGYASGSYVYDSAAKIFAQNPSVDSILVGAKFITSTPDASWTAAMNAIRQENRDWYGFTIKSTTLADQKEVADYAESATNPKVLFLIRSDDDDIIDQAANTAGYQTISNTGSLGEFLGTTVPAIASQTDYELDITVDGTLYQLANIDIDITDDWDAITAAIQTALRAATGSTETVAIDVDEKIKVTSATTGESSTILIAAGTAGTGSGDLLAVIDALGATYVTSIDTAVQGSEDIAIYIQANSYERSAVFYSSNALTNYIDSAAMGERFPKDPGSGTWKFKTLSGITADSLTTSERSTALAKNANIYIERAGISMTEEGTVGVGEYLDVIRGIDWLESRIQEIIFSALVNSEKIPFTDEGITTIEGLLKQGLSEGVRKGVLASYETSVPLASDVSAANKASRTLPDVTFTAVLAGAIHFVQISGVVSV